MAQSDELSNREKEVLNHLLQGKSNKQIASSLHVTKSTVEFHLKNIYAKYKVSSRTELILKLGQSIVAGKGDDSENRDRLDFRNWATRLKDKVSYIIKELRMNDMANASVRGKATPMTFYESIRVCLTKYADFHGRASRAEFWWFMLFILLVAGALSLVNEILSSIFLVAMLLPFLAVGSRRLRDSGKSPWWQLFLLVPAAGIVVVGFMWALEPDNQLPEENLLE